MKAVDESVIVYAGQYFAVFEFVEFLHLYASLDMTRRSELDCIFARL